MPELETAYIDPNALLGALTIPKLEVDPNLGPSGPHDFDDEVTEAEVALAIPGLSLSQPSEGIPSLSIDPGSPPIVAAAHYTQVLDQLWPEFDDPEERTAARLSSLLEEVIDEAQRVHLLAQDAWEKVPSYKVPDSERKRYDKEFLAYLRRLQDYKKTLADLDPDSTATDTVYIGLVRRRDGAGPVPDAIMHLYFAQQLGILLDHADEMGEGFVDRVMDGLAKTKEAIERTKEKIGELEDEAKEELDSWWDRVTRPWKIAGGLLLGAAAIVGTVVVADKIADDRDRERKPWQ